MRLRALLIVFGLVLAGAVGAVDVRPANAADTRPNIVLVTTDDMNDYDLRWMPETRALIEREGTEFTDFSSQHPLCCPARASLLTGQYAHNNGVHHNQGPYNANALVNPDNNIGAWLQDGGYRTGFIGKFLNGFDRYPVAGWNRFNHSMQASMFNAYGYEFSDDRSIPDDLHMSDYVGRQTVGYVRDFAGDRPFFIWTSQIAPHNMKVTRGWPTVKTAIPAKRHRDLYSNAMPPSLDKPSFNEANVKDKPKYLRDNMEMRDRRTIIKAFRQRIRSLKAVDEQVGHLVAALKATGELRNTVILFTSDNGYLLGEHRLVGKNYAFEEAMQVPMLIRGPGIPVGSTVEPMTIVDVAATVADVANVEPQRTQDGRSLIPVANGEPGYDRFLIQAGHQARSWSFRGIREEQWTYAEHYGGEDVDGRELYDRDSDPYQLRNVAGQGLEAQERMADALAAVRDCSGSTCYAAGP